MKRWSVAVFSLLVSTPALAQEGEPAAAASQPTVLTEDNSPIPDPNVPELRRAPRAQEPSAPVYRYTKSDYPVEFVKRPLTLAEEQAQISLDMPFINGDGHPTLTQVFHGAYGVTRDYEVGVTYSVGLERLSARTGEDGFAAGKAFSLDNALTILPQLLAAELRLAFLVDPDNFGVGVILGLPFKWQIAERWALFAGQDLVHIKIKALPVDPADPASTLGELDNIARGVQTSHGRLDVNLGAAFQPKPNVVVYSTFGFGWPDFSTTDQPWSLFAGATYTAKRTVDLGARLGFYRLDRAADTFSIGLYGAVRL
jgi:hypothetical protein